MMLLLAILKKAFVIYVCGHIVFGGYRLDEIRRIGHIRITFLAIASLILGMAINLIFSNALIWRMEFWTSGAFTDDAVAFLILFAVLLMVQILRYGILRR